MVSILYEMFMNIYSIYIYVYMKLVESMVTLCYKDKLKESRLKYFTRAWYMGKSEDFFYRGKGRVMHIAIHV